MNYLKYLMLMKMIISILGVQQMVQSSSHKQSLFLIKSIKKLAFIIKNQIEQRNLVEQQLPSLKHNNLYLDNENPQATTTQATNQPEVLKVKIISSANRESRFVHNEKLAIILEPTLTADDHPIFIINGILYPAHFENGVWKVN